MTVVPWALVHKLGIKINVDDDKSIENIILFYYFLQGMATITPSDFSDVGCYRVFLARFLVIFRVLGVIAGHWRAQIFNSWVL